MVGLRQTIGRARNEATSRFTRQELGRLEVLGQVDRKFIACLLRAKGGQRDTASVILVDQHAADERIRVEHIMRALSAAFFPAATGSSPVDRTHLPEPVPVLLNAVERRAVDNSSNFQNILATWGFDVELPRAASNPGEDESEASGQLLVTAVPQVLARKVSHGRIRRDDSLSLSTAVCRR